MSVFNGEKFLPMAVQSILDQTYSNFEFFILDDGSTDDSWSILESFAKRDQRIRLIRRENKGFVFSLNELIAASTAPLIARMDCDDISMPERLSRQVAFLDANPDYGVVGSQHKNINENGDELADSTWIYPLSHEQFLSNVGNDALVSHAAAMIRRHPLEVVGGYRTAFRHCEDIDLWLRLSSITRLCSLPEALVSYRSYSNQVSSRHIVEQQLGATISINAFRERLAGRPDPTEKMNALPPLDQLDALFGRKGVEKRVLETTIPHLLYSKTALRGDGFKLITRTLAKGGSCPGLWRTVGRLALAGAPLRAAHLLMLLLWRSVLNWFGQSRDPADKRSIAAKRA